MPLLNETIESVDKIRNKIETIAIIYGSTYEPHLEKADSFGSKTLNKPKTVYHKYKALLLYVS